jgi:hypothetical protein
MRAVDELRVVADDGFGLAGSLTLPSLMLPADGCLSHEPHATWHINAVQRRLLGFWASVAVCSSERSAAGLASTQECRHSLMT